MSFHPIVPWSVAVLAVAVAWAPQAQAHDLADGYLRARAIVARHLEHAKLNSAYGTPAFDETGRRIGDIFLNFTGQDSQGRWMLMSLTLAPGGSLQGETDPDNPREDRWGHHEKPPVELDAWLPPEEAVATAINLQPGHAPTAGISLAYYHGSCQEERPNTETRSHRGREKPPCLCASVLKVFLFTAMLF
ncbi:MAG: hypothetical protein HY303_00715 [Candidatus Wallbacteria bacterium]|nr:hypothetical protein [Candidatus Wallbacteria bacterium]